VSQEPVKYDASHIQVLAGWEAVRKRPGMYIGSTGQRGLHQLVFEIAGRAVNEVLAGRATHVEVALLADGGVRVADDGPGVPFEDAQDGSFSGLEAQLTRMNFRPARGPNYPVLDFCGVGPSVVNALSSRMVAELERDGVRRVQRYARGVAVDAPVDAGPAGGTATVISFWPDSDIFETTQCSFDALAERFAELAYLNPGLDILLSDQRRPSDSRSARFCFPGGLCEMVASLDERATAFAHPDIVRFEQEDPRMEGWLEVALRWRESGPMLVQSYGNNRPTSGGGTHVAGFLDGVGGAINVYARKRGLLATADPDLTADHISEGLTVVVSVKLEHPQFEGATRGVLGDPVVYDCVREASVTHLGRWLEEYPQQAAAVIGRIIDRRVDATAI
jgi:DNA gyrase subunit B